MSYRENIDVGASTTLAQGYVATRRRLAWRTMGWLTSRSNAAGGDGVHVREHVVDSREEDRSQQELLPRVGCMMRSDEVRVVRLTWWSHRMKPESEAADERPVRTRGWPP